MKLRRSSRTFIVILAALTLSASVFAQEPKTTPDIKSRLDGMMAKLEKARLKHHVAGLGIAVVYNDEIILCDGLGEANIENGVKATGDTVFAIGSSTKAFTATGVGILVDEVKMSWDDHVRNYLPDFHLMDKEADEKVTIRALLSHRTGLNRMDLLWANGKLSREEILAATVLAEPGNEFGEFNYCNTNFIAAGAAAGKAYGSDWETLTRERLLEPLKMTNASLTVKEAKKNPNLATGYKWDEIDEKLVVDPMRTVDNGAPAGSINASARDMANWLRLQLGRGELEGTRIINAETLEETWKPHVSMGMADLSYGLGWMIGEFGDQRLIAHGGNIDGFSAQVAFLPEENLGYVLLMNIGFSPLQALADSIVLGTLLEEPGDVAQGEAASEDFTPYLGKYVANFAHFKDARFTVQIKDGSLAVDVPGQMLFELKPPDAEGKRAFALTDTIAVSFDKNEAGEVIGMKMYQGGLVFECPREGVEIASEVSLDDVRDLMGIYHFEVKNVDCEVLIKNGRLAIDVPGQMTFEMHPPDEEGLRKFRATDAIAVKFNRGEDGDIESLTMFQGGMEFVMPRTGDADATYMATLEEVMALQQKAYGSENLSSIKTLRLTGTVNLANQGIKGRVITLAQGFSHYRNEVDLGKPGRIIALVAGDRGWSATSFDATEELRGKHLESAKHTHPLVLATDWRTTAQEVKLEGVKQHDGRPHYVVRVKFDDELNCTMYVDADTGLVSHEELILPAPGIGGIPATVEYMDYRNVGGVMLPSRAELHNDFHGKTIVEYDVMEANVELPADAFAEPPAQIQ